VKTLHDEVDRVKTKVKSNIDGAANAAEKKALLRKYLLDQYREGQARDEMAQRLAPEGRAGTDEPEAVLMRLFDEALSPDVPVPPSESKALSDKQQKREQIAHLLIHLAPRDAEWQQRVAAAVGLRTYIP